MILKSFDFQCDFDFDFQITTSKMIWILILNHLYLGDLILILKSSTYDDFAHLCLILRRTAGKNSYVQLKIKIINKRNQQMVTCGNDNRERYQVVSILQ